MTRLTASSLFGFAPDGVYLAATIASHPVRSYRTLSAFPSCLQAKHLGSLLSVALSLNPNFTFEPAGCYPASCSRWSPDFPQAYARDRPAP